MNSIEQKREELLVRVARMYYLYDLSQNEIAKRECFSRSYISKLLTEAKERGLVKIEIKSAVEAETVIEKKFKEAFALKKVIVVPQSNMGERSHVAAVGHATGQYVDEIIQDNDIIGISWGQTIYESARSLSSRNDLMGVSTIQLCGGLSNPRMNINASDISNEITDKISSTGYILPFPAVVGSKSAKSILTKEPAFIAVMDRIEKARILLLSVGAWGVQNSISKAGYLSDSEIVRLNKKGAIGDICTHFVNAEGKICDKEIDDRTIAVPFNSLKYADERILPALGASKVNAIVAALKTKIPNVFITDENTALQIMNGYPDCFEK